MATSEQWVSGAPTSPGRGGKVLHGRSSLQWWEGVDAHGDDLSHVLYKPEQTLSLYASS